MITELGHFALILALAVALAQVAAACNKCAALAPRAAVLSFVLLSLSFVSLMHAYAVSDFSVWSVVQNSHTMMPFAYKIAAVWGNHEGSMLLWVWILSAWGLFAARSSLPPLFRARVLAFMGMIASGFIAFILFTSDPFRRIDPPAPEGLGLNPVLQDPALAIHPPLLYAGYVGFSVAACFALAALLEDKVDEAWARRLRPWVLAAWIFLTAGIVKGALWAYYELGWGGFWFWDPVENASLMPWLAGTALLHSCAVLEKRGTLKAWTVFLALLAFSFSLLGTFLVRSGILTSVHTFAADPSRGIFILMLLACAVGGAFLLYALRTPRLKPGGAFGAFSRESALLLNNVFLFTFCATVFTGTLYPIFLNALDLGSVSVGPPYYRATLLPLLVPFALLMGAAPAVAWRGDRVAAVAGKMLLPLLFTAFTLLPVFLHDPAHPLALLGFFLGAWIVWATLADAWRKGREMPASYFGMVTAHIGFAVLIMGVSAATQWGSEKILWMKPSDRTEIAGRTVAFLGSQPGLGPDYNRDTGIFTLAGGVFMTPEKRWYPVAEKETSETALRLDGFGLLYLVMGEEDKKIPQRRVVRLYYHPFITWVFGGGFLMYMGGLIGFFDRKRRQHG